MKQLTLPQLELMAMLIAIRLTNFVLNTLLLKEPPVFIWLDSQIILHWVQGEKALLVFVNNRVTKMQAQLPTANWLTLENPAYLLTRGTSLQLLKSLSP